MLGTLRQGRYSEHAAKFVLSKLQSHPEIETKLFDVRDFKFPLDNEGQNLKELNTDYRDAIIRADGLVIVSPEYNHGYPGSLKMALDTLLKEYVHKAVGLVGVSAGGFGATRVIEQLVGVVRELGLVVTFSDLNFSNVRKTFDENGKLLDDSYNERADKFIKELVWMSKILRTGRESVDNK